MGLDDRLSFASSGTHPPWPGSAADPRAVEVGRRRGFDLSAHKARRVSADDFALYDDILAMDRQHLAILKSIQPPNQRARLRLFLESAGDRSLLDVPDPYFGNLEGFERVFDLCELALEKLLADLIDAMR